MEQLETYCNKATEMGIDEARIIRPNSIVTAEWVRMKCQFGCSGFGMRLCCPPFTPTPDVTRKVIDSYEKAILVHHKLKEGERGKGAIGFKGFNAAIVLLEREIFLDGYYKAWSMGSGPCRLCNECDPTKFCRHGVEARPAMEACGIDVFKTGRDNGFSIQVVRTRDEERNIFGVVLIE
jgi:predicted metal-binding protein